MQGTLIVDFAGTRAEARQFTRLYAGLCTAPQGRTELPQVTARYTGHEGRLFALEALARLGWEAGSVQDVRRRGR